MKDSTKETNSLWHVGCDGMAIPVMASSKEEAEQKALNDQTSKGYRIHHCVATPASDGYRDWVSMFDLRILQ